MAFELCQDPRVPVQCQVDTGLLLRCDGDVGIPSRVKQGNRPSSRLEAGKTVFFLTCAGKLSVPLEWARYLRKFLEFGKACKDPFKF